MSDIIRIKKLNETYIKLDCERGIMREVGEFFTFQVPNAHFMPSVKEGSWDGKIRLLDYNKSTLYYGLIPYLIKFCKARNYQLIADDSIDREVDFTEEDAQEFIDTLNLPFEPYDYQFDAFVDAVRKGRRTIVSPTASGKSLIIYMLLRYYDTRSLIIVPTISLVKQLYTDFLDYSHETWGEEQCHLITGGVDKNSSDLNKYVYISTWQSIFRQKHKYFKQFKFVTGDEAHLFKAQSLTSIMTKLTECPNRYGLTGTLDGTLTNKLVLEGLFGAVRYTTTTKKLMDEGKIARLDIKSIVLGYPDAEKKSIARAKYPEEMDWIVSHDRRNNFIKKLATSLEGNTLLLFQYVEKHGKILKKLIEDHVGDTRNVYYVDGSVSADSREEIRKIVETERDAIIIASYGTFSTGINIRNLHNIIFGSPSKSIIRICQSIGRMLRLSDTQDHATLYDIADDLIWKSWKNHTIKHFADRIKIYIKEEFTYKIHKVKI